MGLAEWLDLKIVMIPLFPGSHAGAWERVTAGSDCRKYSKLKTQNLKLNQVYAHV
jgi:hypothetical protein